jgi:hypothetical protein
MVEDNEVAQWMQLTCTQLFPAQLYFFIASRARKVENTPMQLMHPTSSSIHISKCMHETSGNRSETSMDFVFQDFYEEAMTAACMHDV